MAQSEPTGWSVTIAGAPNSFAAPDNQPLLTAMIRAGRSGIKVGCRNGGCGVCRVRITSGTYASDKMTRSRISEEDERHGIVLACRIYPRSDIALEPLPLGAKVVFA